MLALASGPLTTSENVSGVPALDPKGVTTRMPAQKRRTAAAIDEVKRMTDIVEQSVAMNDTNDISERYIAEALQLEMVALERVFDRRSSWFYR